VAKALIREGKTTGEYLREAGEWSAHNYHPLPIVLGRGEGVEI